MTDAAHRFVGSMPQFYDRCLGPLLFEDFGDLTARRVAAGAPKHVLEMAAGTGIVTARLMQRLPDDTQLVATDLNAPMIDFARAKLGESARLKFQTADALALPFADASFDTVVCQYGVMFFPDKDLSYREAHRVLKPGGRYVFAVWDSVEHNTFQNVMGDLMRRTFPSDPPNFFSVPMNYFSIDTIRDSLWRAGFSGLSVEVMRQERKIPDFRAFAEGVIRGTPASDQIAARGHDIEPMIEATEAALRRDYGARGAMPLQSILLEARRN